MTLNDEQTQVEYTYYKERLSLCSLSHDMSRALITPARTPGPGVGVGTDPQRSAWHLPQIEGNSSATNLHALSEDMPLFRITQLMRAAQE
jgi:hypothetical protein